MARTLDILVETVVKSNPSTSKCLVILDNETMIGAKVF